jgi:DNA-binding GntR family transcriptional regulator
MSAVPPFNPEAGEPGYLWEAMADHITARIKTGDLVPGARLPGERDLASEYGVALMTARRALRELRERGLVRTLPSKGTFIASPRARD